MVVSKQFFLKQNIMDKTNNNFLQSSIEIFKQYKSLADKAMQQINEEDFYWQANEQSNNVYLIIKHMQGNMKSRWTDFLTTDGEKEWRKRDAEFEQNENPNKTEMLKMWDDGWNCLFNTLELLTENDLSKIITIRSEPHSVMQAINRQIAHYASHVGQIVFICKLLAGNNWQTLSIARGKSQEFNHHMQK